MEEPKAPFGVEQIHKLLPHRYPMLMLDRVLDVSKEQCIAQKMITADEPCLQGHFPDRPIFPGVLILEALAQTGGIWAMFALPQNRGMMTVFAGIDAVRFRRQVVPGDTLELRVRPQQARAKFVRFEGEARVGSEVAAEAILLAAFVPWPKEEKT